MKEETKKAIDEANDYYEKIEIIPDINKTVKLFNNALTLALAEIEEKDNRIKELGLKLDAYSTHNIDRTFEKDKLVNRIAFLESKLTAIREDLPSDKEIKYIIKDKEIMCQTNFDDFTKDRISEILRGQRTRIQNILDK